MEASQRLTQAGMSQAIPIRPRKRYRSRRARGTLDSRIAVSALKQMFDGKIAFSHKPGAHPVQVRTGIWKDEKFDDCLSYLESKTGSGLEIDPLERPTNAWRIVSQTLALNGMDQAALDTARRYVAVLYEMERSTGQGINKADALASVSDRLREIDDLETARGAMLLAYSEDLTAEAIPSSNQRHKSLASGLRVPKEVLSSIAEFVGERELHTSRLPPEEIMIRWELSNAPDIWVMHPRIKKSSAWGIRPFYTLPFNSR